MAKHVYGERIGKFEKLVTACAAVIFDDTRERILLTRRSDNGFWCLPGGAMNSGESVTECCAREVLEETGLVVVVRKLVGVYSSPHVIIEYADGNRHHALDLVFETSPIGGDLSTTDETSQVGYFSLNQMKSIELWDQESERIADGFAGSEAAFVR